MSEIKTNEENKSKSKLSKILEEETVQGNQVEEETEDVDSTDSLLKDDQSMSNLSGVFSKTLPKMNQGKIFLAKLSLIKQIREWFGLPELKEVLPSNELEKQILLSMEKLMTLIQDCNEAVNNVRNATIKSESERLRKEKEMRSQLLTDLDNEQKIATRKYNKINDRWQKIKKLNDPLDIHNATNQQRDKCVALLERKDAVIGKLKGIIKTSDKLFLEELVNQEDEINILIDRIDEQLEVLPGAYRNELELIEVVTAEEKEKCLTVNRERWNTILEEKSEMENARIKERYDLIDVHKEELDRMIIESQETVRETKLEYLKHIRELSIKVEEVRSICELNTQKLKYNYNLLLRREEDNKLSKRRLQRTLNDLQKKLDKVKSQSFNENKNLEIQIKKLKDQLNFYTSDISAIDKKADTLAQANCKKYFQLWDYNQKVANDLVKKILDIEKLFYEQQLNMPWENPGFKSLSKESLLSYKKAKIILAESGDALSKKRMEIFRKAAKEDLTLEESERRKRIFQGVFEKIGDKAGFLREDKLELFMEEIPEKDKKLIRIDRVFYALGIANEDDMIFFSRYLLPYLHCHICDYKFNKDNIPAIIDRKDDDDLSDIASLGEERGVLNDMARIATSRFQTSCNIIYKELCDLDEGTSSTERLSIDEEDSLAPQTVDPSVHPNVRQEIDNFHFSDEYMLAPEEFKEKQKLLGVDKTISWQVPLFYQDKEQLCKGLFQKPIEPIPDAEATDKNLISCKLHKHTPIMPTIYIINALRDFMIDYYNVNREIRQNLADEIMSKNRQTISRLIDNDEVTEFWNKYKQAFTIERQEMWSTFQLALKNYITDLRKRHKLNEDIRKIKRTNLELRRLLQRYLEPRRHVSLFDSIVEKVDQALEDGSTSNDSNILFHK